MLLTDKILLHQSEGRTQVFEELRFSRVRHPQLPVYLGSLNFSVKLTTDALFQVTWYFPKLVLLTQRKHRRSQAALKISKPCRVSFLQEIIVVQIDPPGGITNGERPILTHFFLWRINLVLRSRLPATPQTQISVDMLGK
jgi:hypothetical protein